ncbi:hypothetical protein Taro_046256, partial [Colocasia esculenta]|nr:hypothetical protein [Colocasia esculenta]
VSSPQVVRLCRPAGWAQRAYRFSFCECNRGWCRVLNATALGVAFWLPPPRGLRLHVCRMSRIGRPADVDHGKATAFSFAFRSRRHISAQALSRYFVYRRGVVLVGLHCSLALLCGCGAAVGPFVRDCETERLVEVLPVMVCPGGGTILVVDPWWYLVLVGVEVDWCSVETSGAMLVLLFLFHSGIGVSSPQVVRLCGPEGWAQRAHRFSIYERDRGWRRILNATALGVAFWLLSWSGHPLHVRRMSCVGRPTDVDHGKATAFSVAFRSRRELGPESLKVPGMGLQLCGLQVWCWLVSTVLWLYCVVVERQLDLSSVTTRLRGSSCVVLSGLDIGIMNQ